MITNTSDYRNPALIRKMGLEALTKELGPLGMAYFIRQFEQGEVDYTKERQALLADLTLEDIESQLGK